MKKGKQQTTDGDQEKRRKNLDALDSLLDPPIAFNPAFKRITRSTVAAVFLSQSWYWTKIHYRNNGNGWWYNSQVEIEEQTGLTRSEQLTARRILLGIEVQEEKLAGVPATLHFRVSKKKVYELLGFQFAGFMQTEIAEDMQSSSQDYGNPDSRVPANFNKESETDFLDYTEKDTFIKQVIDSICLDHSPTTTNVSKKITTVLSDENVTVSIEGNVMVWRGLNGNSEYFQDRYKPVFDGQNRPLELTVEFLA